MKLAKIFSLTSFLICIPAFVDAGEIAGFRELKFGMSLEEARKIYIDLNQQSNKSGKEKLYLRQNDNNDIGSIRFDEIVYSFKENMFYGIAATIKGGKQSIFDGQEKTISKIAKTINAYNEFKGIMESRYGPANIDINNGANGARSEWIRDDTKISLNEIQVFDERIMVFSLMWLRPLKDVGF